MFPLCHGRMANISRRATILTLPKKGFSVLRRSYCHASPMGLPGPFYVLRRVVVPMEG